MRFVRTFRCSLRIDAPGGFTLSIYAGTASSTRWPLCHFVKSSGSR
jgi:hypothetical protein